MTLISNQGSASLVALRLPIKNSEYQLFEIRTSSAVNPTTHYVRVDEGGDGKKELVPFEPGK